MLFPVVATVTQLSLPFYWDVPCAVRNRPTRERSHRLRATDAPQQLHLPTFAPQTPATDLSPFERAVLRFTRRIYRDQGRKPVRTVAVSVCLGDKHTSYIRRWLVQLEHKGHVQRVGQRGGWIPIGRGEL